MKIWKITNIGSFKTSYYRFLKALCKENGIKYDSVRNKTSGKGKDEFPEFVIFGKFKIEKIEIL